MFRKKRIFGKKTPLEKKNFGQKNLEKNKP